MQTKYCVYRKMYTTCNIAAINDNSHDVEIRQHKAIQLNSIRKKIAICMLVEF